MPSLKTTPGNFFEDFKVGQILHHATPRTVTEGDVAVYTALYGGRVAMHSSVAFAAAAGHPSGPRARAPVDDLLVFHIVFGKTVPDISLNAVANLGYAECQFLAAVYPGDTLSSVSEVIGVRENSSGDSGVVYVRTTGTKTEANTGATSDCLSYVRWVMVRKRDKASPAPTAVVPKLADRVDTSRLGHPVPVLRGTYDCVLAGSRHRWGDYEAGERIDHIDGMTVEEAEHQLATRLYQNTAKVHFVLANASSTAALLCLWPARCRSTAWPMRSTSRQSTAVGMWPRCLLATQSMPGAR
jgi:2-methylfumaryl-CoA hydratase